MTYVYVLTSTPKDFYYEQCLMSLYSLRLYMSNADAVVLCDNRTFESFSESPAETNKRAELAKLASKIIKIDFADSVTNIARSRMLKTSIPDYIDDDFLFIDCDTIICGELTFDEKTFADISKAKIAAVLDGHVELSEHKHKKYFLEREKKLGFSATKTLGRHFNSGVIFFKKCEESRNFFKEWNKLWTFCYTEKHDHHDQSAFNEANLRCGKIISELPGEWNCQISQGGLYYLKSAKIIHYFSSEGGKNYIPYYKLADKKLQVRIKENGTIPDDVKEMIADPKFQFNKVHLINDQRIVNIMQSPLTFTLADINEKMPHFFNFLEAQAAFVRKVGKKLKGGK